MSPLQLLLAIIYNPPLKHLPDRTPFVERLAGAIIVGGTSGSGVMKADGGLFRIADLSLRQRAVPPEEFAI